MSEPNHNPLCGSDGLCKPCAESKQVPEPVEAEDFAHLFNDYGVSE